VSTTEAILIGVIACPVVIGLLVSIIVFSLNFARIDLPTQRQAGSIARLERKIDLVMRHLGVEEPRDSIDPVLRAVASGNKIALIKLYREQTGAGAQGSQGCHRGDAARDGTRLTMTREVHLPSQALASPITR
jgi:hypothetical protein